MTMNDLMLNTGTAITMLGSIAILAITALKGWNGWLSLKRAELEQFVSRASVAQEGESPSTATRIEVADLKERIRKLEAIAAGVDL